MQSPWQRRSPNDPFSMQRGACKVPEGPGFTGQLCDLECVTPPLSAFCSAVKRGCWQFPPALWRLEPTFLLHCLLPIICQLSIFYFINITAARIYLCQCSCAWRGGAHPVSRVTQCVHHLPSNPLHSTPQLLHHLSTLLAWNFIDL